MRRRDLEKLRKLDPKLAAQLERAMAAQEAGQEPPLSSDEPLSAQARPRESEDSSTASGGEVTPPPEASFCPVPGGTGPACREQEEPSGLGRPLEALLEAQEQSLPSKGSPEAGSCCGTPEAPGERPAPFVNAVAQAGLPEVPQTLVGTEASPAERLAELWAGYPDEEVPGAEQERRKAEAKAKREAERARDAAHSAQLGFFPGGTWRRRGTGPHVRCEQLELKLDGIEKRRGRRSMWEDGRSASVTMAHVEAQCFTVRELGDRSNSLPEFLRGQHPTLTRTQKDVLRAVVTAYMAGALGVYEYEAILASDLGMSERAFRYALNGGKDRPPGLVELGLVKRRQTWKQGTAEGRPSEHHYLLLQVGPELGEQLLPWACTQLARLGRRVPKRSGYTRRSAAKRAVELRQKARVGRREAAERVVRRKLDGPASEPVQVRREATQKAPINCAAQTAVNPVPPPTGEGGLGRRRGRPLQIPFQNDSLRELNLAPPPAPPEKAKASDPLPCPKDYLRDRARALDEVARPRPSNLDVWRRRRARGAKIPDDIDQVLFAETLAAARNAILGGLE